MILIENAMIVNEYTSYKGSVLIENGRIKKISNEKLSCEGGGNYKRVIDADGLILMPGVIDMHVHFREPGLTHKGDTESESRAALAGGVTSYAEMPNTVPKTLDTVALNKKIETAEKHSYINYSYYIGAWGENSEVLKTVDNSHVPGVKVFMGASTGNMQIKDDTVEKVYNQKNLRVTAHCEDDEIIGKNIKTFYEKYGDAIPFKYHPVIRSTEACLKSTQKAVELTKKYGNKLHIAHISTEKELDFLQSGDKPEKKQITAEVCTHHLWFNEEDYKQKGSLIKWNPAIKKETDRLALLRALAEDKIDIIVTDHAPHTWDEKQGDYTKVPSGAPMIQHSLQVAFELYKQGYFTLEQLVDKMCHQPARLFGIKNRGYIKEGYFADLVLLNPNQKYTVKKENILYKCGWSPLEGTTFSSKPEYVFVNGNLLYEKGKFGKKGMGMPLVFDF